RNCFRRAATRRAKARGESANRSKKSGGRGPGGAARAPRGGAGGARGAGAGPRAPRFEATPGPVAQGLYDPALDKDSCGVGFIADIKGKKSHKLVEDALAILCNLEHRGAVGADPRAGDGAGILVQIPHKFFAK